METSPDSTTRKAGYVAIVGRPNVGKSTLLNALVGVRISSVSMRPQTTRNRIVGIVTEAERGQIAFIDTPGIHEAEDTLNQRMVKAAWNAADNAHAAVLVVDFKSLLHRPETPLWGLDLEIYEALSKAEVPIILAINQVDRLRRKEELVSIVSTLGEKYDLRSIIPISALKRRNLEAIVDEIFKVLPESEQLYEEDLVTDRPEHFTTAELIREQVFIQTRDEVPYTVTVTVDSIAEDPKTERLFIKAVIHVERDHLKSILIGRAGERIREIGKASRKELQRFFGRSVHLELFVHVQHKWRDNPKDLEQFGFGEDEI